MSLQIYPPPCLLLSKHCFALSPRADIKKDKSQELHRTKSASPKDNIETSPEMRAVAFCSAGAAESKIDFYLRKTKKQQQILKCLVCTHGDHFCTLGWWSQSGCVALARQSQTDRHKAEGIGVPLLEKINVILHKTGSKLCSISYFSCDTLWMWTACPEIAE